MHHSLIDKISYADNMVGFCRGGSSILWSSGRKFKVILPRAWILADDIIIWHALPMIWPILNILWFRNNLIRWRNWQIPSSNFSTVGINGVFKSPSWIADIYETVISTFLFCNHWGIYFLIVWLNRAHLTCHVTFSCLKIMISLPCDSCGLFIFVWIKRQL